MPMERRKKIGFSRPVVIVARHTRRYERAYHRKTAADCSAPFGTALVDKRPPGQREEDVLERAAADEDALGLDAALVDGADGSLTVVRVDEDPVREHLQPRAETLESALDTVSASVREPQLDDLPLDVP